MAVFRVNKDKNYTVVSNYHLKDKRLSLKAKGLLTVMLSLPDDWDYSAAGLVAICKEGESAVKAALKELKDCKYLIIDKLKPGESGSAQFEYVYNIYEQPHDQGGENLPLENLGVENLAVENHGQLNTNNKRTKELNTKNMRETTKRKNQARSSAKEIKCPECGHRALRNMLTGVFECGNCMWDSVNGSFESTPCPENLKNNFHSQLET